MKSRPKEVRAQQEGLLSALQSLAAALNVKLRRVEQLLALDEARVRMPEDSGV
jgi:hypothetical protein